MSEYTSLRGNPDKCESSAIDSNSTEDLKGLVGDAAGQLWSGMGTEGSTMLCEQFHFTRPRKATEVPSKLPCKICHVRDCSTTNEEGRLLE